MSINNVYGEGFHSVSYLKRFFDLTFMLDDTNIDNLVCSPGFLQYLDSGDFIGLGRETFEESFSALALFFNMKAREIIRINKRLEFLKIVLTDEYEPVFCLFFIILDEFLGDLKAGRIKAKDSGLKSGKLLLDESDLRESLGKIKFIGDANVLDYFYDARKISKNALRDAEPGLYGMLDFKDPNIGSMQDTIADFLNKYNVGFFERDAIDSGAADLALGASDIRSVALNYKEEAMPYMCFVSFINNNYYFRRAYVKMSEVLAFSRNIS